MQMNARAFEIQNVLFNFCGINNKGQHDLRAKSKQDIFGRIKKLPAKSTLLASY